MNFGIIGYGNIARKFVKSITYTSGGRVHATPDERPRIRSVHKHIILRKAG